MAFGSVACAPGKCAAANPGTKDDRSPLASHLLPHEASSGLHERRAMVGGHGQAIMPKTQPARTDARAVGRAERSQSGDARFEQRAVIGPMRAARSMTGRGIARACGVRAGIVRVHRPCSSSEREPIRREDVHREHVADHDVHRHADRERREWLETG
jgi:hypothetical protein